MLSQAGLVNEVNGKLKKSGNDFQLDLFEKVVIARKKEIENEQKQRNKNHQQRSVTKEHNIGDIIRRSIIILLDADTENLNKNYDMKHYRTNLNKEFIRSEKDNLLQSVSNARRNSYLET